MEPIPETLEAIEEYGPFGSDDDLLDTLRSSSEALRVLVPHCVGLSVASFAEGLTFTVIATSAQIAALDGFQYIDGGPCVTAVEADSEVALDLEALDEHRWQLFAQASAASSIASTLTLPILVDGAVSGSINLYASTPHAFDDQHEAIAEIFNAWAPGAVTNADLAFSTRTTAQEAPRVLHDEVRIQVAIGILTNFRQLDAAFATEELHAVALRAGISDAAMAEAIIGAHQDKAS